MGPWDDYGAMFGNYYVIVRSAEAYCLLAHLMKGSIPYQVRDPVAVGDVVGRLGHGGSSHFPHLHFQVMDSMDLKSATGLPCCFEGYYEERDGKWNKVICGIPHSGRVVKA